MDNHDLMKSGVPPVTLKNGISYDEGILWLERAKREDEQVIAVNQKINAAPLDGAVALVKALKTIYGWVELRPVPGFFGPKPPVMVSVEVGPDEYIEAPWGNFQVPGLDGELAAGQEEKDGRLVFVISGTVKKKHRQKVVEIAELTRKFVAEESIYLGKALILNVDEEGMIQPKFMKLNGLTKADLVLPRDTAEDVQAGVFNLLEKYDLVRALKVPHKRCVVAAGLPGTGKTLTMTIAAGVAVKYGRTVGYVTDIKNLSKAINFMLPYIPKGGLIIGEDIDRVMGERDDVANTLLNVIDGVDSKNLNILFFLTTNYGEKLIAPFRRAGRGDWIIQFPVPDAEVAEELVRRFAGNLLQASKDEMTEVGEFAAGMLCADIREIVERAKQFAISNVDRVQDVVLTKDSLILAAKKVRLEKYDYQRPPDTPITVGSLIDGFVQERRDMDNSHIDHFDGLEKQIKKIKEVVGA